MQIHIDIDYDTHYPSLGHNTGLQHGNYEVDSFEYEIDPGKEAARVAKIACDKLIRDNVSKVTLRKVIYNETNDISEWFESYTSAGNVSKKVSIRSFKSEEFCADSYCSFNWSNKS